MDVPLPFLVELAYLQARHGFAPWALMLSLLPAIHHLSLWA